MSVLSSQIVYKDLKEKGLQLTAGCKIQILSPQQPKNGILKKISSIVSPRKTEESSNKIFVQQILNNSFLVVNRNTIFVYRYNFDQVIGTISVELVYKFSISEDITDLYVCPNQYLQQQNFPIIFKVPSGIWCFVYDYKNQTMIQKQKIFIKLTQIIGVGWVNDRQCLVLTQNFIFYYTLNQGPFKLKQKMQISLRIQSDQKIMQTWIFGVNIDENQDSLISIFYTTTPNNDSYTSKLPPMKLKIKQITRTLQGNILISNNSDYIVQTQGLQYRKNFNIIRVQDYYCLQLSMEILVLRKRFQKYMLLDNMTQIMSGFDVRVNRKGLVVSIGEKLLELSSIHFSDPKCHSRVCDVIQLPSELIQFSKCFKEIWPIYHKKEFTLIFVFQKNNQILLSGLIKLEPMHKMLALAKKYPKQKLQIVQDMALNLGIPKKDFYMKLWQNSNKHNSDIYQYLIPCFDLHSIKQQLKSVLRTRTIQVSQILKILDKISEINIMNLKSEFNQKTIMQYLKNDFLKRKIKLNQMDKMLDHRIFDSIYNSSIISIFGDIITQQLYPVSPKIDPLHSNIEYQAVKQLKSLQNVFQQFKVLILEDYTSFIRLILSKYPLKILQILTRFNFLLPNHPFEIDVQKPSKTNQPVPINPKTNQTPQQVWFQPVSVREWQYENTKQKMFKMLMNDYPTSKIIQTIDELSNSKYGRQNKLWKHGLITLSLDQYTKKIKSLNKIYLYMNVCSFANEMSVEYDGDPNVSTKILELLEQKNLLCEPDMHHCRLYTQMHYFMLKNKIIPKNKLEIIALSKAKPQNLLAMFFLQNKRRKQHIFAGFKNLYVIKNEFKDVLQRFVSSQNCSKIELQILMNEVIRLGQKFQQQNQDLIQLLISGICMKVQIRQTLLILDNEGDEDGTCLIDQVQLSKPIALKINRIKQLKRCRHILHVFRLSRMTYQQFLDLQKDNQIFKLMISKFFQIIDQPDNQQQFVVYIEGEAFYLQKSINMLATLIYLQETVYYSAKVFDIFMMFGLQLIMWRYFDVIKQIFQQENAIQKFGISKKQYLQTLIIKALQDIYLNPDVIYDQNTRQLILNILSIDNETSSLKIRQIAKLDLVDIFTSWDLEITAMDMHLICENWKTKNREQFIVDLIDKYIEKLNFETFYQIYRLLEVTDKQSNDIPDLNEDFVVYLVFFAKKLLKQKRYNQVIQIITSLQKIDYSMLVESYIQTVIQLFPQKQDIGRMYIDFFVQKYNTSEQYSIRQLLQSNFDENVLGLWNRSSSIILDNHYCFEQFNKCVCVIDLDLLWNISLKNSVNISELYFTYFFLTMGLTDPKVGFGQTVGISYNLQKLSNILLSDLQLLFINDQNLCVVDYAFIESKFLISGMIGEAAESLGIQMAESDKRNKFDMIVKELRARRAQNQKNDKILNILLKLKSQVGNRSKRTQKKQKFRQKVKALIQQQQQKNRSHIQQGQSIIEQPSDKQQIFLKWKDIQEQKKQISNHSAYLIDEKGLIDQVYTNFASQKDYISIVNPKKKKSNIFDHFFITKGTQNVENVVKLIESGNYKDLKNCSPNVVFEAIEKVFTEESEIDYSNLADIMQYNKLGVEQKVNLFKISTQFMTTFPNWIKRQIFSLNFLTTPINNEQQSQQDKYLTIYNELLPSIREIIKYVDLPELQQVSNLIYLILDSNQEFISRIYLQQLIFVGYIGQFNSNSVLVAQQCLSKISKNLQIISENATYQRILASMANQEMKVYVKQNLIKMMSGQYSSIAQNIRSIE